MKAKLLILLIFFVSIVAHAEDIRKPYEITKVLTVYYFFDTYAEMTAMWNERNPDDFEDPDAPDPLMGFSYCANYPENDFAECDIYVVRPNGVDDNETLTIGHEVLHGIYGPEYHE